MEMDSIDDANGHMVLLDSVSLSASPENSVSTELTGNSGIYGEPEILPRVGIAFQADIPDLEPVLKSREKPDNASAMSIPLMWMIEESENEDADLRSRHGREALGSDLADPKSGVVEKGRGFRLVPGCPGNNVWSEIEKASFLLGLHVFGKNFVLVKRLSGVERMGDIMSYYYGDFYGSDMYLRWRGCGKTRGRKCNYGQRIFTGSRHQELLSRLLVDASEECRNAVLEMSKAFGEGKLLIEEYVFGLEAMRGLSALIEAVGIGKGKRDLIGNPPEAAARSRREIPAGKPLSSLAPKEIMSILKGDFRLSKAKASDIFWESVWPLLLARGWHSEQPGTHLVYLRPGVEKFSRTELSKGLDYFDSVTDVLSLIAADPDLLEIDADAGCTGETKAEPRGPLEGEEDEEERRQCYLKPPRSSGTPSWGGSEFTVVDTSRAVAVENGKLRERRSLPAKAPPRRKGRSEEEDDDGDSSEVFDGDAAPKKAFLALLALPAQAKKVRKLKLARKEGDEVLGDRVVVKRRKKSSSSSTGSSGVAAVLDPREKPQPWSKPQAEGLNQPQTRTFIDLNVPVYQSVVEIDEVSVIDAAEEMRKVVDEKEEQVEVVEEDEEQEEKEEVKAEEVVADKPLSPMPEISPEPERSGRRQSMRNRPPTTRALEAFAYGFMDEKKKRRRKTKNSPGDDENPPRPRRRARIKGSTEPEPESEPVMVDFPMDESQSLAPNGDDSGEKLRVVSEMG